MANNSQDEPDEQRPDPLVKAAQLHANKTPGWLWLQRCGVHTRSELTDQWQIAVFDQLMELRSREPLY